MTVVHDLSPDITIVSVAVASEARPEERLVEGCLDHVSLLFSAALYLDS